MVRRDLTTCDIWSVARHADNRPFTIAAAPPVCPHCGTTLLAPIELAFELDRPACVEAGPVFDFVRSLS